MFNFDPFLMKLGQNSIAELKKTYRGFDGELVSFSVSLNTECWFDADVKFFSCDLFFWLILVVLYKGTSTFVCTLFFVLRPECEFLAVTVFSDRTELASTTDSRTIGSNRCYDIITINELISPAGRRRSYFWLPCFLVENFNNLPVKVSIEWF